LLFVLLSWPRIAAGTPAQVVIEIEAAAEAILDVRVARRLVSLELLDIDVPPDGQGRTPALFYRVLGRPERQLRVELWERGELYDVRVVSGAQSGGQLLARRVALAAAELARRLRQRRVALKRDRDRELERLRTLAALAQARTREGPLALRAELAGVRAEELNLLGSSLTAEVSLRRSFRVDLSARSYGGWDDAARAQLSLFELGVGPAVRWRVAPRLDLDFSALAAVAAVHVGGAVAVDDILGQRDTWTARAGLSARVEPRLSRGIRASLAAEGGLFLRAVPSQFPDGSSARFSGLYVGAALGLVLTPR
jgi:hypothetical protein